jgi:GNAT superfamily N-acetyltransferase
MPEEITVRSEAADSLVAVRLVEAMIAEIEVMYEMPSGVGLGPGGAPADFGPPGGAFVVVYENGAPVGGGGVKRFADGVAEIKRMFVVPAARRRGHGRRLLDGLEAAARELGYRCVRLDTGARQPEARAMFESAGFHSIEDYNDNPYAAFWGEKVLR